MKSFRHFFSSVFTLSLVEGSLFLLPFALCLFCPLPSSSLPAFPGAEGWGANALGGRGGQVLHVTSLSDNGPGTLRDVLAVNGPKIVVFDVSGVINLQSPVFYNSFTTIAGQTAPGGSITLAGAGLHSRYNMWDHDIIIRFVRARGVGLVDADGDCIRLASVTETVVDHCSASWSCDETIDAYHSYNTTFQWGIIAEAYSECVTGSNIGRFGYLAGDAKEGRQSFHHNLMAHYYGRTPLMATYGPISSPAGKYWDVRNNLFFDCQQGGGYFHNDNAIPVNMVGNYYKGGNSGTYSSSNPAPNKGTPTTPIFVRYNCMDTPPLPSLESDAMQKWFFETGSYSMIAKDSFAVPPTSTTTGRQAYVDVLSGAGCWPRDSTDRRIIRETLTRSGRWANKTDPQDPLTLPTASKPADSDNDGMPNAWETAHGLNPNNASDHTTKMNGGYDALEVYINEVADLYAPCSTGWSGKWITGVEASRPAARIDAMLTASPNPFYASVDFRLNITAGTSAALTVYDARGRALRRWSAGDETARHGVIRWSAEKNLPAGAYLAVLKTPGHTFTRRVVLIR